MEFRNTPNETAEQAAKGWLAAQNGAQEVKIDTSQVPLKKQTDPRFLFLLADTRKRLSDPNERKAICIHEGTHILYLGRAGGTNFEYTGPQITYDAACPSPKL